MGISDFCLTNSLWEEAKETLGKLLKGMFWFLGTSAQMEKLTELTDNCILPWFDGLVGWSIISYTQRVADASPSQCTYLRSRFHRQ